MAADGDLYSALRDSLRAELVRLRQTGIINIDGREKFSSDEIELVLVLLESLHHDRALPRATRIRALLSDALNEMAEKDAYTAELLRTTYGLKDELWGLRPGALRERGKRYAEKHGGWEGDTEDYRKSYGYEQQKILQLADFLIAKHNVIFAAARKDSHLSAESAVSESSQSREPTHLEIPTPELGPTIERDDLAAQLDRLFALQAKDWQWALPNLVVIVGEPGTGKSHFIRHYLHDQRYEWLQAETDEMLLLSACRLLERRQVVAQQLNVFGVQSQIADLLGRDDAPEWVIFDGWANSSNLFNWLPTELRSRVIVTTRIAPPADMAPTVDVGPLTAAQARQLIVSYNPEFSAGADELATLLGRRAGALAQACALLLREPTISVPELCRSIRTDIARVLQAAPHTEQAPLAAVYLKMIASLSPSDSTDFLIFLSFVGHANVTERCALSFFADNPGYLAADYSSARVKFLSAMQPLLLLGLVRHEDDRIYVDPLTAHLVRTFSRHLERLVVLTAFRYFTFEDSYSTLFEFWDLKDYGWTAADIASYFTMQWIARIRLNVNLIGNVPPPAVLHDPGSVIDEAAQAIWEEYFMGLYYFDRTGVPDVLHMIKGRAPRRDGNHLMVPWILMQNALQGPNPEAAVADALRMASPDRAAINQWLQACGMPALSEEDDLRSWRAAALMFELMKGTLYKRPDYQVVLPYANVLAELCHDMVVAGYGRRETTEASS